MNKLTDSIQRERQMHRELARIVAGRGREMESVGAGRERARETSLARANRDWTKRVEPRIGRNRRRR